MLNPYIAGNPIQSEKGFFGREAIFKDVQKVLTHPEANAIVLYGQRRIGKTSILLQLEKRLRTTGRFTPVYFDLQDKSTQSLTKLLFDLAGRIAASVDVDLPMFSNFNEQIFKDVFLPAAIEHATGNLVLLLDEFDVLDSPSQAVAGRELFPFLRTIMSSVRELKFVFVVGRRPEDMSIETLSTFKGVRASRVSRLNRREAAAMVRQSEEDKALIWLPGAEEAVWDLCQGHSYFTQLLCSVVFDNVYDVDVPRSHEISEVDVTEAIEIALQQGANAFHWIWAGLPPGERVVTAAMAESGDEVISHDDLIAILNRSGVRLIVRELELAPETLVQWEILEETEGGYRFVVPLLRRWVSKNRPLRRVKDELDRLDPLAEGLFQTGQHFYQLGQKTESEGQLRQSLTINPNHLKSKLLLGRILLESGRVQEAVNVLEEAYAYDQAAARADLTRVLLASADEASKSDDEKITIYERILSFDPHQNVAKERLTHIERQRRMEQLAEVESRATECETNGMWRDAVDLYRWLLSQEPERSDWQARLEVVSQLDISLIRTTVEAEIASERWDAAQTLVEDGQQRYTSASGWEFYSQAIAQERKIADRYAEALRAQRTGNRTRVREYCLEIINWRPEYKDVLELLLLNVKGVDVQKLKREISDAREAVEALQLELSKLEVYRDPGTNRLMLLRELAILFGSADPEAFVSCPACDVQVKGKNLLRHILHEHGDQQHEH